MNAHCNVYLDIETLPNLDINEYAETVKIEAPKNYKDPDKIDAYIEQKREGLIDDIAKEASLSPIYGRVFCYAIISDGKPHLNIGNDEKKLLLEIKDIIAESDVYHKLYTYNGKNFDVPFINMRARVHGIGKVFAESSRYDQSKHFDVYEYVTHFGGYGRGNKYLTYKQNDIAVAFGMPKRETDGSDVYKNRDDHDFIRQYCADDCGELRILCEDKLQIAKKD